MEEAGERARELRRAGKTIEEIKQELGTRSSRKVAEWLRGEPPNPSIRRRKAKVGAREEARRLRVDGLSYNAIAATLGVAKSSVSVWCQDIVLSEEQKAALMLPVEQAQRKRGATARAARIRRTQLLQEAAAAEIGELADRELFLIGVTLYWAEGSKQKPWSPSGGVTFINSDASVIATFLAWLRLIGITPADLIMRVAIHEHADIDAAHAFWAEVAQVPVDEFRRPTLKRHNPKTVRRNTGEMYVGCLVVEVRRSTDLNRRIAGWWAGLAAAAGRYAGDDPSRVV
ncbi:MAG TPA: hypothetical protein VM345_10855 [Acidimicrobiales bacterium]|nr:hypothetical protein [Acidimicrobiales bacterium]